jgi:glutamyl-tRNA reductase
MSALGPGKDVVLVGASHKTVGVAEREAVGVPKAKLPEFLRSWRALPGVDGLFVLSTCNRTEVVAVGGEGATLGPALREAAFARLAPQSVYLFEGAEAVFHLFSVCSGLRSMVLGEYEIQAQIKDAAQAARDAGVLDGALDALIQQALKAGKRVRTETAIGLGTLSVASAAVELAARVSDDFGRLGALVIGAGETGVLAAKHLRAKGLGRLVFANRTSARAEAAAAEFGGRAASLENLPQLVAEHDLIVACVETPEPLFDATALSAVSWPGSDAPKVFLDLSVPRAIDPSVNGFRDAFLFDLDAVESVVASHREARRAEVERADRIIVDETAKFLAFRTYAALSPAMAELGARFEEARAAFVAGGKAGDARVDEWSRELTKQLLAVALARTKDATRLTQSPEALERTYRRYVERAG